MKKCTSLTLLLITILAISACAEKKTGSTVNQYITNPVTGTGTGGVNPVTGTGGTGALTGCSDAVVRSGATKCYYTNLNKITLSGPGTPGPVYWSSINNLPTHISPNQFRTDAKFAVRMKPSHPAALSNSLQGRKCSDALATNFNKLKVYVMLRRSTDTMGGELKELTADVGSYSNTARFTPPGGTTNPYILEVVGVQSDHRCTGKYGTPLSGCSTNPYYDIPVDNNTFPTNCVAFNLEFATDETYDLPN